MDCSEQVAAPTDEFVERGKQLAQRTLEMLSTAVVIQTEHASDTLHNILKRTHTHT